MNRVPRTDGRARGGLVKLVMEELRRDIGSNQFAIGDKLPSQSDLAERFHVSRTVVREAVVSLQADGLVEAQQGAGVFVRSRNSVTPFSFKAIDPARISSMLETLELRAAVEIEASGLAAQRRSHAQEEAIFVAHHALASQVAKGGRSADIDFVFHRAVAVATNNPRFVEFLDLLGQSAIPRAAVQADCDDPAEAACFDDIVDEHKRIAIAISAGDDAAAREAMRQHLKGSHNRYRRLLQTLTS